MICRDTGQRAEGLQQLTQKVASLPDEFGQKTEGLQQLTTEGVSRPASFGVKRVEPLANALKTLHSNTHLWLRVKMYHHDLKHFSSDPAATERLLNTHQPFFMSDCYFSEDDRNFLLHFPTTMGLPLREFLDEMRNAKGGESGVICSSHDLAPIIEKVFGLRKGYEVEKRFQEEWKIFRKGFKGVTHI